MHEMISISTSNIYILLQFCDLFTLNNYSLRVFGCKAEIGKQKRLKLGKCANNLNETLESSSIVCKYQIYSKKPQLKHVVMWLFPLVCEQDKSRYSGVWR